MSSLRKGLPLMAVMAVGALALSACGGTVGGGGSSSAASGSPAGNIADTISFGMPQAPFGYNPNSVEGNSVYNAWVDNAAQAGFTYMNPEAEYLQNEDFGTYEKVSDDPLVVEYTFADKAVWSDGAPIDCDDFVMVWAAMSGKVADGVDDTGAPASIFQGASTNGWADMQQPECAAGDKTVTLNYDKFYVDWENIGTTVFQPAHIVAQQGGLATDDDGADLIASVAAAVGGDAAAVAKLKPAAEFWSTAWNYPDGQVQLTADQLKLMPSSGPYVYVSGEDNVITMKRNDNWWGEPAKTETLVLKVIAQEELPQALANNEIDAFQPSSVSQDAVDTLKGMEAQGVKALLGPAMIFTHIDLAQGPGMVFEDPKVREAFLKCVPRQDIVDVLAKPVDPEATINNLHEYQPFQPDYATVLENAPSASKYDEVDIEGAKALLAEAGKPSVSVRFLRPALNPIREQIFQMVQQSCGKAGFTFVDTPEEKWSSLLPEAGTSWDAVIFGWAGSGTVAAGQSIYITGGDQNFGQYSDPKVDELWSQIVAEQDPDNIVDLKAQLEEQLWANPYNVVLYADSILTAYNESVSGIVSNPTQYGPTWNIATWTKAE